MGVLKNATRMLSKEYRKTIFYAITLVFATAITVIFLEIINDKNIKVLSLLDAESVGAIFTDMIGFIIIIFSIIVIIFSNGFYLRRKTKEISIVSISGYGMTKTGKYLIVQNFLIMLLALPFGLGLGYICSPFVSNYIYHTLQITSQHSTFSISLLVQVVVTIFSIVMIVTLIDAGYVYRNRVVDLLRMKDNTAIVRKGKTKLPSIIFVIVYFLGVLMLITSPYDTTGYLVFAGIGSISTVCLLHWYFPEKILQIKTIKTVSDKYKMIALGSLENMIQSSKLLIFLMVISVTLLSTQMLTSYESESSGVVAFIAYIIVIIMLCVSLLYKYMMEAQGQKKQYQMLYVLGYTVKQLQVIVRKELFYYYGLLLLLPGIYMVSILGMSYFHGEASIGFALTIIGIYVLALIITALLCYISYDKQVIKLLKREN
ncbi:MAG: FtsX-like permease family protein [Coprobacillaceae bacterium]